MESSISIGGKLDKDSAANLESFVEKVFKVGRETCMCEEVIIKALELPNSVVQASNVAIDNRQMHIYWFWG